MHQPLYRSPRSGRYSLPWVRLHGLKDYYDMASIAAEHPSLHLTFNIVPSLLDQLEDYAEGRAADPALELARRPAADLSEDERAAILDLFFSVPYPTLIAPYPRYAALFHKRGQRGIGGDYSGTRARFKQGDLRDLQVWFHLAWCGRALKRRPEVRDLFKKGDGFTEDEKLALLDLQGGFLREILPVYRRLLAEGRTEIATSPYYHPILPLLCDLGSAREAIADLPLPDMPFRRPADAAHQVKRALSAMELRFGVRPAGVWPSEGSLSEDVVRLLGDCGVAWTASDEDVLRSSSPSSLGPLAPEAIHRPYRLDSAGENGPAIFFRDHALSDLVGFTYASWPAPQAAEDFAGRLRSIAREAPGGVVCVILDGENAWEYYKDNGAAFLGALYERLTQEQDLRTVTFSEALDSGPAPARLSRLRAGSWIGADFTTWIGHPEKNKAWSLLALARQEAEHRLGGEMGDGAVWEALAAAEGSDWFWWFGEDHSSEQDLIFDAAFRDLLSSVYQLLGAAAPKDLDLPIKRVHMRPWLPPTGPIRPAIDGVVTDYFEWLGAGSCEAGSGQAAMHQASGLIRRVAFGSDGRSLFVRVDPDGRDIPGLLSGLVEGRISLEVISPESQRFDFQLGSGGVTSTGDSSSARAAAARVLEVELPLPDTAAVEFFVTLAAKGATLQRLPRDGAILVSPGAPPDWSV